MLDPNAFEGQQRAPDCPSKWKQFRAHFYKFTGEKRWRKAEKGEGRKRGGERPGAVGEIFMQISKCSTVARQEEREQEMTGA